MLTRRGTPSYTSYNGPKLGYKDPNLGYKSLNYSSYSKGAPPCMSTELYAFWAVRTAIFGCSEVAGPGHG